MTTIRKRVALFAGLAVVTALVAAAAFPHETPVATHAPRVAAVTAAPSHAPAAPMPLELLGFALVGATQAVKVGFKRSTRRKAGDFPMYLDSDVDVVRVNKKEEPEIVRVKGGRPLDDVDELTDEEIDELTARRVIRALRSDEAGALEARTAAEAATQLAAEQAREMEILNAKHEAATAALDEAGQLKTDEKKAQLAEKQDKERTALAQKHAKALAKEQGE